MQFASKMMLVPYNKDSKCINTKSESEKILKTKKLNTNEKLIRYRARVEQERGYEKSKKAKGEHQVQDQEVVKLDQDELKADEQDKALPTIASETSRVEHQDLHQIVQQLQQQLQEQRVQQKALQKEHEQQYKIAKSKSLQLRELQDRVYISPDTDSRPTKKRKVLPAPPVFPFTFTQPLPPPPTKQSSKKLLTQTSVHKLDVMPEEADRNPNLPAFGVYTRQFVVPNKKITRSALNWKQY